ncbi:MAG: T9SS type A sorting domain-containing protein [Bacteroidetes bacterium]|nr:T9SS type A sorting domain-containing protein [Bacteroidota bacterium]
MATFNHCAFRSNYGNAIGSFSGPSAPLLGRAIEIRNCSFYNGGFNGKVRSTNCNTTLDVAQTFDINTGKSKLLDFRGVNFRGRNTLEYCRENGILAGCNFNSGNINNNVGILDYSWYADNCWKDGIPGFSVPDYSYIHDNYFSGNCVPIATGFPPLDPGMVTINNSFQSCPTERFTNPVRKNLWSSTANDQSDPITGLCDPSNQRMKSDEKKAKIVDGLFASPVPATDFVNIHGTTIGKDLFLFDVLGNLILKQKVTSNSLQINLSDVPCGVYYLRQQNNKSVKIVKTY